ncbi:alpha/beta hydrolase fold domain-containing protein [Pedobacter alpinus]|uniref:Alpha/beta hydrolase fold domain-containing protein n=1 Tax=Pedobacter alpinus TaxID=1590643 RepID=A0ABW5TW34_9SPHI
MKNFIIILSLFFAQLAYAQEGQEIKQVSYPVGYQAQLNVVYTTVNNWDGKMDLYLAPKANGPSPIIINIHGGGWARGSKDSQSGFGSLFKQGYSVANISYRLAVTDKAPAAIEDTRCALIYLIKNAKALNIDINKIVIMGSSAGGHLALMGGLLANNPIFDKNCAGEKNIKVAAIIDKYGVSDISEAALGDQSNRTVKFWLGDKFSDNEFKKSISPIYYVTKNSPPIFIVHGDADPTVSYQQSVELAKKLNKLGVKHEFITVKKGGHGGFVADKSAEVSLKIIAFLKDLGI